MTIGDFKSPTTRRQRELRFKNEFAFFQSLSQLFLPTYFVKCRQILLELILFLGAISNGSENEIKFFRCLFTHSKTCEIRHFQVIVQKRAKKCTNKRDARAMSLFCS